MAMYQRMQDLRSVDSDTEQRPEDAIDITQYAQIVLQVRVPVGFGGTTATLYFQTAAVAEDSAFVDITPAMSVSLLAAGDHVLYNTMPNLLRYLRWRVAVTGSGAPAQFLIDLVARER